MGFSWIKNFNPHRIVRLFNINLTSFIY
jgi:hypothetical protein